MRSVVPMRTAKIGYIVMSALLCVLGILLIALPEFSISAAGGICGAILIVFGMIRLVGYFSRDLYRLAFQYDLALGSMMMVLGVIMLLYPGSLMNFICITMGLSCLADGLFKVQITLDARRFGTRRWWLVLILAAVTVVFGAVLIARPSESSRILIILTGITMMCEGVLNIGTMVTAVKIIKHQRPDVINVNYEEGEE